MTGRFRCSRMRMRADNPSSFGIITSMMIRRTAGFSAQSKASMPL